MNQKPKIIVFSEDTDNCFDWISVDWFQDSKKYLPESQALYKKAKEAIKSAKDVPDAVSLLERAGFEIEVLKEERN